MIVPFPAASVADVIARKVGERASKLWGQSVIIENITGAAGATGAIAAMRAPADGYTILVTAHPVMTANPWLYDHLPYDPKRDFAPAAALTSSPNILLINANVPARSVAELVKLAKDKPGTLNFGSGGSGTTPNLSAQLFKRMAQIDIVHVPYRGSAPAALGLMAGDIQILFDAAATATSHIQGDKVRALATSGRKRLALLPQLPTMAESGFPDFESTVVIGAFVPAGAPPAVVGKLNADFNKALADPEVTKYFNDIGSDVVGGSVADFDAFLNIDRIRMRDLIQGQGIKATN